MTRVTFKSNRQRQTYLGWMMLPAGINVTFTSTMGQHATLAFQFGMLYGGGFARSLERAIKAASALNPVSVDSRIDGGSGSFPLISSSRESGKARLIEQGLAEYQKSKRWAEAALRPGTCVAFLIQRGINPTDVNNALYLQTPYDGLRSTISMQDAGLFTPGNDEFARRPVKDFFGRGRHARTPIYKESARYDVYFNPASINSRIIIHEALHSATLLDDIALARKLTGRDYTNHAPGAGSVAINDVLAKYHCGFGWK